MLIPRLQQRVVVHRVERQDRRIRRRPDIQAGAADRVLVAVYARHIRRIRGYAVRKQLLDQARIRRVPVPFAVYVNSHRSHICDVDHIAARQLALNIQVPVVGCAVREMSIEDDRSTIGGAIGNAGRWRLRGNDRREIAAAQGIVEGLHREVGIGGLKRRIGTGVFDLRCRTRGRGKCRIRPEPLSCHFPKDPRKSRCGARYPYSRAGRSSDRFPVPPS